MITALQMGAWLTSLVGLPPPNGSGVYFESKWQPLDKPSPDRMAFLTLPGGPGTTNERVMDRITVTILCRGKQRAFWDAEALAASIDDAILAVVPPVTIGGSFVNDVDRLGAPPRYTGEDESKRSLFTCTYIFAHAR